MEKLETLYLYAGENQPNVKLTCIYHFATVGELCKYFHGLQNAYNVQFTSCETVTDNLKIACSSYGYDSVDAPFYIVEYDEEFDSLNLWKTDGDWAQSKIFSMLYKFYSKKSEMRSTWVPYFENDKRFIEDDNRDSMTEALDKLNIDWSKVSMDQFWLQFNKIYEQNNDDQPLKTIISLAILRCEVLQNMIALKKSFKSFYNKMRPAQDAVDTESTRESSHDSTLLTVEVSPASPPSPSIASYIYQKDSTAANQIINNFNSHFKLMAEDYEIFELKTKFNNVPQRKRKPRRKNSQNSSYKNRISKIK